MKKWIHSLLAFDRDGKLVAYRGYAYDGPIAECKPGKSDTQKQSEATATADQAKEGKLTDTAQGTLSQFEGPVQQSPFYKALLTQGTEATSRAYDTARANTASRAKAAGFGYAQPIAQGAQDQVGAQEASTLAELPQKTMLQAADPAMRAATTTGEMGTTIGGQGVGYQSSATQLEQQRQQNSLWNKLWSLPQAGAAGAGAFLGAH